MNARIFVALLAATLTLVLPLVAQVSKKPTQTRRLSFIPSAAGGFGDHVDNVFDFNLDGYEDYAVSAPSFSSGGAVFVFSGRDASVLLTVEGDQALTGSFGDAVCAVGDVSGDGQPDLVVGSHQYDDAVFGAAAGRVYCFSGSDGQVLWTATGDQQGGRFGRAVGVLADVGPNAATSIVVGQPNFTGSNGFRTGRIIYLNPATGLPQGDQEGLIGLDQLGERIGTRPGVAEHFSSSEGGRIWSLSGPLFLPSLFLAPHAGSNFPPELEIIFNSGGTAAGLAVGRPSEASGGFGLAGAIHYFPAFTLPGATLATGTFLSERIGESLAAIRDIDGDGNEEIGFTSTATLFSQDTRVRMIDLTGSIVRDCTFEAENGVEITSIQDTTGDGKGEWIMGLAFGGSNIFESRLYSEGFEFSSLTVSPSGDLQYQFAIDMGPVNANQLYLQLYGASGHEPGFVFNSSGPHIPLFMDFITTLVLEGLGDPAFPDALGFLGPMGTATTNLILPPSIGTLLSGVTLNSVAVTLNPSPLGVVATSNPICFEIP